MTKAELECTAAPALLVAPPSHAIKTSSQQTIPYLTTTPSSTLGTNSTPILRTLVRHACAASVKNTVMRAPIPDEVEMSLESRLLQHIERIPAHWKDFPLLHIMMIVQRPTAFESRYGSLVYHGLSIVFAVRLQAIQSKQAVGGRVKFQIVMSHLVHPSLHGLVFDGDARILDESRILESAFLGQILKIIPVKGPAQALSPENFIVPERRGHAPIGIHVREVQLASRLEQSMAGSEHRLLVGTQVNNAVADDNVHRRIFQRIDCVQIFDQS